MQYAMSGMKEQKGYAQEQKDREGTVSDYGRSHVFKKLYYPSSRRTHKLL